VSNNISRGSYLASKAQRKVNCPHYLNISGKVNTILLEFYSKCYKMYIGEQRGLKQRNEQNIKK